MKFWLLISFMVAMMKIFYHEPQVADVNYIHNS